VPRRPTCILGLCLTAVSACGGSDSPSQPSPPPGSNPHTITISAAGAVEPKELTVPPGTRVTFVNSHTRQHDMTSDPHPDHQDCPELNQVGLLATGQTRETGNLVTIRTCGYHDHSDPNNASLRGRIIIR
jgi:plastocyanin